MKTKQDEQSVEEEWQAAQVALSDAQKLPGGPERIEALKKLTDFDTRPTNEGVQLSKKSTAHIQRSATRRR